MTPRNEVVDGVQEEQITRNILASWQVQRSMHSEVKKVLEVAKRKKRNERVVRLVDAAANGDVAEVSPPVPPCTPSVTVSKICTLTRVQPFSNLALLHMVSELIFKPFL